MRAATLQLLRFRRGNGNWRSESSAVAGGGVSTIAWQDAEAAVHEGRRHGRPVLVHLRLEGAGEVVHSPVLAVHHDAVQLHRPAAALPAQAHGLRGIGPAVQAAM